MQFITNGFWRPAAVIAVLSLGSLAQAAQFANFNENGTQPPDFTFSNNGTNAQLGTIAGGVPVTFDFANGLGAPAGDQVATLTISGGTTTTPGTFVPNGFDTQPLDGDMTIMITRNFDSANLLTVVYHFGAGAMATINGIDTGTGASWSSSTQPLDPTKITFTSAFLTFAPGSSNAAALSFSDVIPAIFQGTDASCPVSAGHNGANFLCSFSAAGTGTFSASPVPVGTPEPGTLLALGGGLLVLGLIGRRRAAKRG
jgi:hypothetical protein